MAQPADKTLKCGVCHGSVEGMNPLIRIDAKLVCSNACFRAITRTEGAHDLDIYWQDSGLPVTEADGIVSRLRPSFRLHRPIVPARASSSEPPDWLDERLRVEQIVVGCSPLAQRLFSLVSDIITVSTRDYCFVGAETLAQTLGVAHGAVIDARDELIDAGALNIHPLRNPRSRKRPLRAFTLPCRTRPFEPGERRESIKELLARVRAENAPPMKGKP